MSSNPCHDDDSQVLSKIGEKLYLKPEKADVHFIIESTGERIPAHKILLSSASDVFEAMFYGSLKEEGDIKIVDASAEAFKEFLLCFYFNQVQLSIENVSKVMYLSNKYDVKDCLRLCTAFLSTKITTETVISTLGLAIIYDQMELLQLCESEIRPNSQEIFQSPVFLDCDRRVLNHILRMDRLSCSETEIFEACMSWVRATRKQEELTKDIIQTHLGDLFYEIRFGSMTFDEFAKLLPSYGKLFTADEYHEILQMISQQEDDPKLFKGCRRLPRSHSWDENKVIKCNRLEKCLEHDERYDIQSEEVTTFSTNAMLLLGYFVLESLFHVQDVDEADFINIHVTILDLAHPTDPQTQISFDHEVNMLEECIVKLPNPVTIKPGIMYEIRLSLPSTDYYYTYYELESTVNLEHDIVVQFFNDPEINGRNAGVIRELGFNMLK